jgi:putative thioredoxin
MTNEIIQKSFEQPVLVDFWAPWCGPCRMLGPVLKEAESKADGRWKLVKINVDKNQALANEHRIMGIPAVKLFHEGKIIADFTGYRSLPDLENWLNQHMK